MLSPINVRFVSGGKEIISPPAMDYWRSCILAKQMLWKAEITEHSVSEMVHGNISITLLVTGFESYCKIRFFELEKNGITPNINKVLLLCYSKKEIENDIQTTLEENAKENNTTLTQEMKKNRRLNFQNYDDCQKLFFKGYDIKFAELDGITSDDIKKIQNMIDHRHRLIHVNPMTFHINELKVPREKPLFMSKRLADDTEVIFTKFINSLHCKTENIINLHITND